MKQNEMAEFSAMLSDALGYYGKPATGFTLQVWWTACQSYSLEQVAKALQAHAMDPDRGQFAPKVADMVRQLSGTSTDRALLAWGKLYDAMSSVGSYSDVVFDDPAIHAVVEDMGGWPKLCRTDLTNLSYIQHQFAESYRAYTGRGEFGYPKVLNGDRSPDGDYAKRGLKPPKPVVIGNIEQARLVYRGGDKHKAPKAAWLDLTTVLQQIA